MQSLVRAMKGRGEEGHSLPPAFASLERIGAKLRRSQLAMIAAASGTGKSAVATTVALRTGVPTLYFSADSDRMTLGTRIGAAVTGYTTDQIESFLSGPDSARWFAMIDQRTSNIGFCWDRGIYLSDIEQETEAYALVHGDWPALIVVDNLKNVYVDGVSGDRERYDQALDFLHEMAGKTGAAVLILHHVTGQYEDGIQPIPLSGLMEKTGKTPRLVLTLYRSQPGYIGACVVKNSNGPMDAAGGLRVQIPFDGARMWFGDAPEKVSE